MAVSVLWVDNLLIVGEQLDIDQIKSDLSNAFVCNPEDKLKEYVGNKIDFSHGENGLGTVKFMQPVLVQKLNDEFVLSGGKSPVTPAVAGQVLTKGGDGTQPLDASSTIKHRS